MPGGRAHRVVAVALGSCWDSLKKKKKKKKKRSRALMTSTEHDGTRFTGRRLGSSGHAPNPRHRLETCTRRAQRTNADWCPPGSIHDAGCCTHEPTTCLVSASGHWVVALLPRPPSNRKLVCDLDFFLAWRFAALSVQAMCLEYLGLPHFHLHSMCPGQKGCGQVTGRLT